MNTRFLKLAMTLVVGSSLYSTPAMTEERPAPKKGASVRIMRGPEIERAGPNFAIVRWTSSTPGGSPVRHGIVRYGTDPKNLSETARSPIRLNPGHSSTVFRVLVGGLDPRTTYYYAVESAGPKGESDGVKSIIKSFTTT
jgi:hypothetical protein